MNDLQRMMLRSSIEELADTQRFLEETIRIPPQDIDKSDLFSRICTAIRDINKCIMWLEAVDKHKQTE